MTSDDVRSRVAKALERGDLDLLLMGDYPYQIPSHYMSPVFTPTDYGRVFQALAELGPIDEKTSRALSESYLRMLGSAEGAYLACYALASALQTAELEPMGLDLSLWARELSGAIRVHEQALRATRSMSDFDTDYGRWSDVTYIAGLLEKSYGVKIL